MGVILELAPQITISGGGASDVDLTEIKQQIEANKQAISDLKEQKSDLSRTEAIERYIISLEERLSRVDIEIEPSAFLFLD